ncbi:hypothetical protein ACIOFR_26095, partial [Kitasatospora sp. NPDC088346]
CVPYAGGRPRRRAVPPPRPPTPPTNTPAAPPPPRGARDIAAIVLFALGTAGLNTAAYTTDPRLGTACTSLCALTVATILGRDNEQQ